MYFRVQTQVQVGVYGIEVPQVCELLTILALCTLHDRVNTGQTPSSSLYNQKCLRLLFSKVKLSSSVRICSWLNELIHTWLRIRTKPYCLKRSQHEM